MNGMTMRMLTRSKEEREGSRMYHENEPRYQTDMHRAMPYDGQEWTGLDKGGQEWTDENIRSRRGAYRAPNASPRSNIKATGTVWMSQPKTEENDGMELDRETAERWVAGMEGTDPNHPRGGKWTAEALKPLAQKNGFPTDGKEFWEFYAMTNAMYSDYAATAKKYGITTPEFYAAMAADFIHDQDAKPDKVERYMRYIAKD